MNLDGFALPVKKLEGSDPVPSLDFSSKKLGPCSAIVIASLIRGNASLTCCNVLQNKFDVAAADTLVVAVKDKNVSLCGIQPDQKEATFRKKGLQPPDAILLASDLSKANVTASLTKLDVCRNLISGDGAWQLSSAVLANTKIETFDEMPIKEMRADSLTELKLRDKYLGVVDALVIVGLLPVMASLTCCNVIRNQMDSAAANALVEAVKDKSISLCGIQPDQTNADFARLDLEAPDAILLASDLSKAGVTASLTQLNLSENALCGLNQFGKGTYDATGIKAITDGLAVSASLTELNLSNNELVESFVCEGEVEGDTYTVGTAVFFQQREFTVIAAETDKDYPTLADLSGIKAIAGALSVSASLTSLG